MSHLPRIAVTMGDPAGVGPELALMMLADESIRSLCRLIVIGDLGVLKSCSALTGIPFSASDISQKEISAGGELPIGTEPVVIECENIRRADFEVGSFNRKTGQASYDYVDLAINLALRHSLDAMTTGPICKEALKLSGIDFPGHTEILASRTQATRSCMMQYSEEITCTFVTVHVGYWQVPALLSVQRISDVIDLTVEAIRKIRHREPKLVVCGLNPHAGEHGLFGNREEEEFIVPAVELAKQRGLQVEGPLPPDTAFIPTKRQTTDAYICMYHDQGHIPVKALAFDAAVNTTLGLPIIRTSVDHGTAYDIAWKGCVNPGSMKSAIRLAAKLVGSSEGHRLT